MSNLNEKIIFIGTYYLLKDMYHLVYYLHNTMVTR